MLFRSQRIGGAVAVAANDVGRDLALGAGLQIRRPQRASGYEERVRGIHGGVRNGPGSAVAGHVGVHNTSAFFNQIDDLDLSSGVLGTMVGEISTMDMRLNHPLLGIH